MTGPGLPHPPSSLSDTAWWLARLMRGPVALLALGLMSAPLVASTGEPFVPPEPDRDWPSALSISADGGQATLSGDLGEGVADRLARLLHDNPNVRVLHLTSEGGYVDEAEAIGDLVAARGLVTHVPDYCISACTLVFVRGRERLISTGARLGFHAPSFGGIDGSDIQADGDPERRAYVAAGVAPDFAEAALRVPFSDVWVPEAARLIEARVVTAVVEPGRF